MQMCELTQDLAHMKGILCPHLRWVLMRKMDWIGYLGPNSGWGCVDLAELSQGNYLLITHLLYLCVTQYALWLEPLLWTRPVAMFTTHPGLPCDGHGLFEGHGLRATFPL